MLFKYLRVFFTFYSHCAAYTESSHERSEAANMDNCCNCCTTELRDKEVVNICDGSRLGYVTDVEIDAGCGKVVALLVPGETRLFSLGHCPELRIPWDRIERIGDDIILCRINPCDLQRRTPPPRKSLF